MRARRKISRAGVELIKRFEGFRPEAVRLPDGRWMIGHGHTRAAREGAKVSAADAEALLLFDLVPIVDGVNAALEVETTQSQFDALCIFAHGVGMAAFRDSEVLKRVNAGRVTEAAMAIDAWRKAEIRGDAYLADVLIRRRAAEKALMLTPDPSVEAAPSALVRAEADPSVLDSLPEAAEVQVGRFGADLEIRVVGAPLTPQYQIDPEPVSVDLAPEHRDVAEPAPEPAPAVEAFQPEAAPTTDEVPAPTLSPASPSEPEVPAAWRAFAPAEEPIAPPEQAEQAAEPGREFEPEAAPEAVPQPAPEPAPEPAPVAAASALTARLYSPYASLASLGLTPTPPPSETAPAAPASPAPAESPLGAGAAGAMYLPGPPMRPSPAVPPPVAPAPAAPPQPPVAPVFAPPQNQAQNQQSQAAEAQTSPLPGPPDGVERRSGEGRTLVLTPPTEDPPPLVLRGPPTPPWRNAEGRESEGPTSLDAPEPPTLSMFNDDWDATQRLTTRIVRHEPVATEADEGPGSAGVWYLLGGVGVVAFAGSVAAFLRGQDERAAGAQGLLENPTNLAWLLAAAGAICVSVSVYFLLKRWGGVED